MQWPVEGDADFRVVVQGGTVIANCCVEPALTVARTGTGSCRIEDIAVSSHGQGRCMSNRRLGLQLGQVCTCRALGCLPFPLLLSVTVTPRAHTATLKSLSVVRKLREFHSHMSCCFLDWVFFK